MADEPTTQLQRYLERLQQGDAGARHDLLNATCERLGQLTRLMLRDYPRVKRWEETGDVLQNALVRLYRALEQVTPPSPRDFFRLATLQIRRELIDLVRHYYGAEGEGAHHVSTPDKSGQSGVFLNAAPDASPTPNRLAVWREFHQQAERLPEEEREVFDLVWYQGLGHTEAAALLGVAPRTVKRRWQAACLHLHDALGGLLPDLGP
jgi:RNA polymerase sigma-70 factor (ECF subfamily)